MESKGGFQFTRIKSEEEGIALMNRLVDVAQPSGVFGEPVTVGDYTLITSSEVQSGLGYGYGGGYGPVQGEKKGEGGETAASDEAADRMAAGSGGGGGGFSAARPVAVVSIGPDGVRVEPVVDLTKLGIAALTTFMSMAFALSRVRRHR
ncbi:MAG TPA: hypothetical protein VMT46_07975 [Anaerolineaceae bacterium]|nr:hypothetical protein [Anaerolineaceae bacterium]